jgi:hypothetical protein
MGEMDLVKRWAPLLLLISPWALLVVLMALRTGRDLSTVLLVGLAVCAQAGVFAIVVGLRQGHRRLVWTGASAIASSGLIFVWAAQEIIWIGDRELRVSFHVIDSKSKGSIENALVRVYEVPSEETLEGQTDSRGFIEFKLRLMTGGTTSLVTRTGVFYLRGRSLKIEADGYFPVDAPFEKYTDHVDLHGPPLPTVEIQLKKKL